MEYQDQGLLRVVGIFSHLAVADEPERPETDEQLAAFREALAIAQDAGVDPEVRHLANTPATLSRPGHPLRPGPRGPGPLRTVALRGADVRPNWACAPP